MSPAARESKGAKAQAPREEETQPPPKPRPYLRSVYPLNPGIPHFMDFPRGWK